MLVSMDSAQFTGGKFRPLIAPLGIKMARHVATCDQCQFVYRVKIRFLAGSVSDYSRSNLVIKLPSIKKEAAE